MPPVEFTRDLIEDDLEQIGLDVRPALDIRAEGEKLLHYGRWLADTWPQMYENLVQGPSKFHVTKAFSFPGKGEAELCMLNLTPRGPVFAFPRTLIAFGEETNLPVSSDVVLPAIEKFQTIWPVQKLVRLGTIHNYVFSVQTERPVEFLARHFTKLDVPEDGELAIRMNRPQDGYNRIVELRTVEQQDFDLAGVTVAKTSRLAVKVDFNNQDMSEGLDEKKMAAILLLGKKFCETEVYSFLNRTEE